MPIFYASKFQNERGRWIYVQDQQHRAAGYKVIQWSLNKWQPHAIYYHFRTGGHVEAVRHHLQNPFFLKADLQQFYNHVSRGKIIRCLIKIGFSYRTAHDFAMKSTVRNPNGKPDYILPFGFVQSPLLATLVLQKSALGKMLLLLKNQHKISVSVYMDDILLSADSETLLDEAKSALFRVAEKASFSMNMSKSTAPLQALQIFNIDVSQADMRITDERMQGFIQRLKETSDSNVRDGIIGYVLTVNPDQAKKLAALPNAVAE